MYIAKPMEKSSKLNPRYYSDWTIHKNLSDQNETITKIEAASLERKNDTDRDPILHSWTPTPNLPDPCLEIESVLLLQLHTFDQKQCPNFHPRSNKTFNVICLSWDWFGLKWMKLILNKPILPRCNDKNQFVKLALSYSWKGGMTKQTDLKKCNLFIRMIASHFI